MGRSLEDSSQQWIMHFKQTEKLWSLGTGPTCKVGGVRNLACGTNCIILKALFKKKKSKGKLPTWSFQQVYHSFELSLLSLHRFLILTSDFHGLPFLTVRPHTYIPPSSHFFSKAKLKYEEMCLVINNSTEKCKQCISTTSWVIINQSCVITIQVIAKTPESPLPPNFFS